MQGFDLQNSACNNKQGEELLQAWNNIDRALVSTRHAEHQPEVLNVASNLLQLGHTETQQIDDHLRPCVSPNPESSQLVPTEEDRTGHENLLIRAEEALRRQLANKTHRLYTEQGPTSSKILLSALCTLSDEGFDQLWAGVLHASTSYKPITPPANDTQSRSHSGENMRSRATGERAQVREAKLENFAINAVGDLLRFVNDHWEQLTRGLDAQQLQGDQLIASKQPGRLHHYLELRRRTHNAELHWLQRALALIRDLRNFEEYLEENGDTTSKGSNQRLRDAYLTRIWAGSSLSVSDVRRVFKEDLRYATRWMIFVRRFGLGAILVCGQGISKLV